MARDGLRVDGFVDDCLDNSLVYTELVLGTVRIRQKLLR